MAEHREHAQVRLTELCLACHCSIHTAGNHEAFQSDAGEDIKGLLVGLSFTEENADLAGASAIYGHVEVTDTDILAVPAGALHLKKITHLLDSLIEGSCL